MKFLSSVGIGLSGVFCCLLLALIAETYYLLWWKRRLTSTDQIQDDINSYSKTKKSPSSLMMPTAQTSLEDSNAAGLYSNNIDLYLKAIDESCIEAGMMMMGVPRFLFTIKEETKEDLELDESRVKGVSRRLSDLMSSPSFFTPPLTPLMASTHGSYNPFNESSNDVEFNMMRPSPPPKFKFLRDADEKLLNRSKLMT